MFHAREGNELFFRDNKATGSLSACKNPLQSGLEGSYSFSRGHSCSLPALKPTLASRVHKATSGLPFSRRMWKIKTYTCITVSCLTMTFRRHKLNGHVRPLLGFQVMTMYEMMDRVTFSIHTGVSLRCTYSTCGAVNGMTAHLDQTHIPPSSHFSGGFAFLAKRGSNHVVVLVL